MKRMMALLLAGVMLLAALCTAGAETKRRMESAADADEWAAAFLGEHPETLEGVWEMTPQMEAAVAQLGGIAGLAQSLASLGAPGKISPAREGTVQGFRTFQVPCAFALMPVDLVLSVQNGAIAGLSVGPYSGAEEETGENAPAAWDSVALALPVPELNGELPGTLLIPKGEGPFPAVVLVQGSGPSDRDETVGTLKPFRDLAEGLAARGVAVYRFDKRTYVYGAQLAADREFTLVEESIGDAANAVQLLAGQERIDPARIWVLGHSLGGNAIPAIDQALAQKPVQARGYVMLAASPRPLEVLMREQTDFLLSLQPEITPEDQAARDALFGELDRLADPEALPEDELVAGAYASYWRWLAAYDPLGMAAEMTRPCLLLQGEEDYQVTLEDFGIWQAALGEKANWRLVSCPGLTHFFTPGQKAEGAAAYARDAHVDAGVIGMIADFILDQAE
ncbi:MAG: alpha/beta fold hydrolase [Clostridia bacterium]|nr:alpha/beta fold hydrolase [Clostridia bacterium]